jgi:hypothetical protein
MRQSLSGDVAPPGNLQLIPIIAIGVGAVLSPSGSMVRPEPLTPSVSFVCLMVSKQMRWVGLSEFSVGVVCGSVVIAMTRYFIAGTRTLLGVLDSESLEPKLQLFTLARVSYRSFSFTRHVYVKSFHHPVIDCNSQCWHALVRQMQGLSIECGGSPSRVEDCGQYHAHWP